MVRRLNPLTTGNARRMRRSMTDAEQVLWSRLRLRQFDGYKFRRQHPIGSYIVDFVCIEARLVIEVDGVQHADDEEYDQVRSRFLAERGYRVIRYWNGDVLMHLNGVLESIWTELGCNLAPRDQAGAERHAEVGRPASTDVVDNHVPPSGLRPPSPCEGEETTCGAD